MASRVAWAAIRVGGGTVARSARRGGMLGSSEDGCPSRVAGRAVRRGRAGRQVVPWSAGWSEAGPCLGTGRCEVAQRERPFGGVDLPGGSR